MPREICKLNLTVEKRDDGAEAAGSVEFHGNGEDKAAVLACVFSALRINPEDVLLFVLEALNIMGANEEAEE